MSKHNQNEGPLSIQLPKEEYPFNNCVVEEGDISNLEEKLVFTTVSNAGIKRRVTFHPNGVVTKVILDQNKEGA